jgi:predicted DsbA family dithiol-disulfide isomerase
MTFLRLTRAAVALSALLLALPGSAWAQAAPAPAPPQPAEPPIPMAAPEPEAPPFVDIDGRESTHQDGVVKMTIFIDFFCSHCHHFDTVIVPALKKEYGDKLQIQFVGYPIVDPKASHIPILAFYLAEQQGKGDQMRELMFSAIWDHRLDVTRPDVLLGIASQAGLDLEAFKRGFNENTMGGRLTDGLEDARAIGARGTPTVLIDNHIRLNDNSLRNVEAVVAQVLDKGNAGTAGAAGGGKGG